MLKKIRTQSLELNMVQDNFEQSIKQIEIKPFLNGVIIKNIPLTSGVDNILDHGLDRKAIGFLVLKKDASGDVWDSSTVNTKPELRIILKSSVNLTVTLWVF